MNSCPLGGSDKGVGRGISSGSKERAAPGCEIVKCKGRGAGDDAIKLFREVLGSLEALPATS